MNSFDPQAYGPVFAQLLATDRRRSLDVGQPDKGAKTALKELTVESAFAHLRKGGQRAIADSEMAECCLAGVWLLHDYLDNSHTISQRIDTAEGSFWHAIMHRREGDFSNSKYWFRHVGQHPVINALGALPNANYDPYEFVDQGQAVVRGKSDARDACLDIQQAEWELLFDYCYQEAVAK